MLESFFKSEITRQIAARDLTWVAVERVVHSREKKLIQVVARLDGEESEVTLSAVYELRDDHIHVTSLDACRPWISGALSQLLLPSLRPLPLPGGLMGKMARTML